MRETRSPDLGGPDTPPDVPTDERPPARTETPSGPPAVPVAPAPSPAIAPGLPKPHAIPDGRGLSVALPPARPHVRPDIRRATVKGLPPLEARTPVSEHHIELHRSGLLDARSHAPPPPPPPPLPVEPPPPLPRPLPPERRATAPGMPTFDDATAPGIPVFDGEAGEGGTEAEKDPLRPNTGIGWFLGNVGTTEHHRSTPTAPDAPIENTVALSAAAAPPAPPLPAPPPRYAPDPMSAPLDPELHVPGSAVGLPAATAAPPGPPHSSGLRHALPDIDLRAERGTSGLLAASPETASTSALLSRPLAPTTHSALLVPDPPDPHQPFAPPRIVTRIALGVAIALPTATHAPWELVVRPTDVTFLGLVALLMTALSQLAPSERSDGSPSRLGLWLSFAASLLLLPFAVLALAEATGPFDAQPFIARLGADSPLTAVTLVLGASLLVSGLLMAGRLGARVDGVRSLPARLGLGLGLALLLTLALVPAGGAVPLAAAFDDAADSPFFGDRVAAMTLLASLLLVPGAVVIAVGPWRRAARALAFLTWGLLTTPLIVLSLFVARSSEWLAVLEPLKLSLFVAAIVLFSAHTLDELIDGVGPGSRRGLQE